MADVHEELDRLSDLVADDAWLTLPDVVERLDSDVQTVRRMFEEHLLIGVRRSSGPGGPKVLQVPALLVEPEPMESLPGTLTVLHDAGFSDAEALRWLFTPDEALGATPAAALRDNKIAPVRRRAQVLGF